MTIYAELLLVENFITGAAILGLTGKLRGVKAANWRIAAGAVMCGIYAFILFVPLHWLAALTSKILFSSAVVMVVFGADTWRSLIKTTAVFYIVSFLMGGVTIAIMYMFKIPGMTGNGSFVLKGATFLQISAGVAATWYLGSWLAGLLREKALTRQVMHEVTVGIGNRCWTLRALIDTGNSLRDPVTGWPVGVLSKGASEKIYREFDSEQMMKMAAIPYRTVSGAGLMYGFRPDRVLVDGYIVTDIVLGFGERNFSPWQGCEKYDLLLHQQLLEGEDMTHGQEYDYDGKSVGKV